MSTPREKLAEIVAGLGDVTPGPWVSYYDDYSVAGDAHIASTETKADRDHIIATQPDAMREIAAAFEASEQRAERLITEGKEWRDMYVSAANQRDAAEARATAAEATVTALQEALEDILAPIAKAQRELEPGQRLSGSAYTILTSAENLREIARKALSNLRTAP